MADIKQAAKWIDEGRAVWRAGWSHDPISDDWHEPLESGGRDYIYSHRKNSSIWSAVGLRPSDLLADDWEIAE